METFNDFANENASGKRRGTKCMKQQTKANEAI